MTEEEITKALQDIDKMSKLEIHELWWFAPSEHPYFDRTLPLCDAFEKRLKQLGVFTPENSINHPRLKGLALDD